MDESIDDEVDSETFIPSKHVAKPLVFRSEGDSADGHHNSAWSCTMSVKDHLKNSTFPIQQTTEKSPHLTFRENG